MQNTNVYIYIAIILVGLLFIGLAINQFMKAKKAERTWLTAPGFVTTSSVQVHHSHSSRGQSTSYEPKVSYQYQVEDQTYNGDRLGFGSVRFGRKKAEKKIADYPQGAPVTVHYDPADASQAVLETRALGGANYLILGILLSGMGAVALVLFLT